MSAEPTVVTRLQQGDGSLDSTQRGCTSWLLISCVVLTATTAFVFGWGLGAPNMYNVYTEPFLKHINPCKHEEQTRLSLNNTTPAPQISDGITAVDANQEENSESKNDKTGDAAKGKSDPKKKSDEPFSFVAELVKGIPQTIFLIGAFIGAITGPFWVNLFDRKRTVFSNYIFCFASSLCVLLASYLERPWLFYLSRLLLGYQGK